MGLTGILLDRLEDYMFKPSAAKVKRQILVDEKIKLDNHLTNFINSFKWRKLQKEISEYEKNSMKIVHILMRMMNTQ